MPATAPAPAPTAAVGRSRRQPSRRGSSAAEEAIVAGRRQAEADDQEDRRQRRGCGALGRPGRRRCAEASGGQGEAQPRTKATAAKAAATTTASAEPVTPARTRAATPKAATKTTTKATTKTADQGRRRRGGVVGRAARAVAPRRVPSRSCVACRTARPKRELLRVVRDPVGRDRDRSERPSRRSRRIRCAEPQNVSTTPSRRAPSRGR